MKNLLKFLGLVVIGSVLMCNSVKADGTEGVETASKVEILKEACQYAAGNLKDSYGVKLNFKRVMIEQYSNVDVSNESLPLETFETIKYDGNEYDVPFTYRLFTQDGWYCQYEGNLEKIELRNDKYASVILAVSDDSGFTGMTESRVKDFGVYNFELYEIYDNYYMRTPLEIAGISLGSSYEDVLESLGNPNEVKLSGVQGTKVIWKYIASDEYTVVTKDEHNDDDYTDYYKHINLYVTLDYTGTVVGLNYEYYDYTEVKG